MTEPIQGVEEIQSQQPTEAAKQYEYKTTIIYDDKLNETIISIQAPQVSPARMLHFLLRDRLRVRNIDKIKGWDTEQLGEILPNRIITGEK